jgi:hypothetical protein
MSYALALRPQKTQTNTNSPATSSTATTSSSTMPVSGMPTGAFSHQRNK